jgi:hypothetical protein
MIGTSGHRSRSAALPAMWSEWPWVTSSAVGTRPWAATQSTIASGSKPGSTIAQSAAPSRKKT